MYRKFLFAFTGLDGVIMPQNLKYDWRDIYLNLTFEKWRNNVQGIDPLWWWKILQNQSKKKRIMYWMSPSTRIKKGRPICGTPTLEFWTVLRPCKKWINFAAHGRREPHYLGIDCKITYLLLDLLEEILPTFLAFLAIQKPQNVICSRQIIQPWASKCVIVPK